MSGQFSSALIFASLIAIAFAANRAEESAVELRTGKIASTRAPASIASNKEAMLGEFKHALGPLHTEKAHGPVSVKIELSGAPAVKVGERFVLRGTISAEDSDLVNVQYKWAVPAGVKLVSGALAGRLDSVSATQAQFVEVVLEKVSTANAQVHLTAGVSEGTSRFADVAQYNTEKQQEIDTLNAMKKAEVEMTPPETATKIFH